MVAAEGARTDQRFADALCGPDGTSDPSVLMPVLQVYPDALAAPMPDVTVSVPPIDVGAAIAAAGRPATLSPTAVPQPGRYGRDATAAPRQRQPQAETSRHQLPAGWGALEPHRVPPSRPQGPRQPAAAHVPSQPPSGVWSGRTVSPGEVAGYLRTTFAGLTQGAGTVPRGQPPVHPPTPPLPRRTPRPTRRNKGSSVWAVFIFLVVVAFASGLAQQFIRMISELFNR